jgi:hypothetical protein
MTDDFYVEFGSNAAVWAKGLKAELKPASVAVADLMAQLKKLQKTAAETDPKIKPGKTPASLPLAAPASTAAHGASTAAHTEAAGATSAAPPSVSVHLDPAPIAAAVAQAVRAGTANIDSRGIQNMITRVGSLGDGLDGVVRQIKTVADSMGVIGDAMRLRSRQQNKSEGGRSGAPRQYWPAGTPREVVEDPRARGGSYTTGPGFKKPKFLETHTPPASMRDTRTDAGSGRDTGSGSGAATMAGTPTVMVDEAAFARVVGAVNENVEATKAVEAAVNRLNARGGAPAAPGAGTTPTTTTPAGGERPVGKSATTEASQLKARIAERRRLTALYDELARTERGDAVDKSQASRAIGGSKSLRKVGKATDYQGEEYQERILKSILPIEERLKAAFGKIPDLVELQAQQKALKAGPATAPAAPAAAATEPSAEPPAAHAAVAQAEQALDALKAQQAAHRAEIAALNKERLELKAAHIDRAGSEAELRKDDVKKPHLQDIAETVGLGRSGNKEQLIQKILGVPDEVRARRAAEVQAELRALEAETAEIKADATERSKTRQERSAEGRAAGAAYRAGPGALTASTRANRARDIALAGSEDLFGAARVKERKRTARPGTHTGEEELVELGRSRRGKLDATALDRIATTFIEEGYASHFEGLRTATGTRKKGTTNEKVSDAILAARKEYEDSGGITKHDLTVSSKVKPDEVSADVKKEISSILKSARYLTGEKEAYATRAASARSGGDVDELARPVYTQGPGGRGRRTLRGLSGRGAAIGEELGEHQAWPGPEGPGPTKPSTRRRPGAPDEVPPPATTIRKDYEESLNKAAATIMARHERISDAGVHEALRSTKRATFNPYDPALRAGIQGRGEEAGQAHSGLTELIKSTNAVDEFGAEVLKLAADLKQAEKALTAAEAKLKKTTKTADELSQKHPLQTKEIEKYTGALADERSQVAALEDRKKTAAAALGAVEGKEQFLKPGYRTGLAARTVARGEWERRERERDEAARARAQTSPRDAAMDAFFGSSAVGTKLFPAVRQTPKGFKRAFEFTDLKRDPAEIKPLNKAFSKYSRALWEQEAGENPDKLAGLLQSQIGERERLAALHQEAARAKEGGQFDPRLFDVAAGGSDKLKARGGETGHAGAKYERSIQNAIKGLEKRLGGVGQTPELEGELAQALQGVVPESRAVKGPAAQRKMSERLHQFILAYEKSTGQNLPFFEEGGLRQYGRGLQVHADEQLQKAQRTRSDVTGRQKRAVRDAGVNLIDPATLTAERIREETAKQRAPRTVGRRVSGAGSEALAGPSTVAERDARELAGAREVLAKSGVQWSKTLNSSLNEAKTLEHLLQLLNQAMKAGTLKIAAYHEPPKDKGTRLTAKDRQALTASGELTHVDEFGGQVPSAVQPKAPKVIGTYVPPDRAGGVGSVTGKVGAFTGRTADEGRIADALRLTNGQLTMNSKQVGTLNSHLAKQAGLNYKAYKDEHFAGKAPGVAGTKDLLTRLNVMSTGAAKARGVGGGTHGVDEADSLLGRALKLVAGELKLSALHIGNVNAQLAKRAGVDYKGFKAEGFKGVAGTEELLRRLGVTGGAGGGVGGAGHGGGAGGAGGGAPFGGGWDNRILAELKAIHATVKAGVKITPTRPGKAAGAAAVVADAAEAAGNAPKPAKAQPAVVPATTPAAAREPLSYSTKAKREKLTKSLDPDLQQLVRGEDKVAAAVALVTQGFLNQDDALKFFRSELKLTTAEAKDFAAKVSAAVKEIKNNRREAAGDATMSTAADKFEARRQQRRAQPGPDTRQETANQKLLNQQNLLADTMKRLATATSGLDAPAVKEIDNLKKMAAGSAKEAEIAAQRVKVYQAMNAVLRAQGFDTKSVNKRAFGVYADAGAPVRPKAVQDIAQVAKASEPGLKEQGAQMGTTMRDSMAGFFGATGFWGRVVHTTGTFLVRNFSAGFVFGLTNALQEVIAQAIETESTFIRVSAALEATGRSTGSLRTQLQGVSTDYGVALKDVYETAAGLTGVFDTTEEIAGATKVAAQLEMISRGALNATEAMGSLASITSAFGELSGVKGLQHIADVLTVIQERVGVNVETTIEGVGRMAGLAQQVGMSFEQTAVFVAEIAKKTNQTGGAAGEQFSRIVSTLQTGRGRAALTEALPGMGIDKALDTRNFGEAIEILMNNYQGLTAAQKNNIAVTLGGQKQAAAVNALLEGGARAVNTVRAAEDAKGQADKRASQISQQLNAQLKIFKTNIVALGANLVRTGVLDFFSALLTVVNKVLAASNKVFSTINDFVDSNQLTRWLRTAIIGFLGFRVGISLIARSINGLRATLGGMVEKSPTLQSAREGLEAAKKKPQTPLRTIVGERVSSVSSRAANVTWGTAPGERRGPPAGTQLPLFGPKPWEQLLRDRGILSPLRDPLSGPAGRMGRVMEAVSSGPLQKLGGGFTRASEALKATVPRLREQGFGRSAGVHSAVGSILGGRGPSPGTVLTGLGGGLEKILRGRADLLATGGQQRLTQASSWLKDRGDRIALAAPPQTFDQRAGRAVSLGAVRGLQGVSTVAAGSLGKLATVLRLVSFGALAAQVAIGALTILLAAFIAGLLEQEQYHKDYQERYKSQFGADRGKSEDTKAKEEAYVGPNAKAAAANQKRYEGTSGAWNWAKDKALDLLSPKAEDRHHVGDRAFGVLTEEVDKKDREVMLGAFATMGKVRTGASTTEVKAAQKKALADLQKREDEINADASLSDQQKDQALAELKGDENSVNKLANNAFLAAQGLSSLNHLELDQIQHIGELSQLFLQAGSNLPAELDRTIAAMVNDTKVDPKAEIAPKLARLSQGGLTQVQGLRLSQGAVLDEIHSLQATYAAFNKDTSETDREDTWKALISAFTQYAQLVDQIVQAEVQGAQALSDHLAGAGKYNQAATALTSAIAVLEADANKPDQAADKAMTLRDQADQIRVKQVELTLADSSRATERTKNRTYSQAAAAKAELDQANKEVATWQAQVAIGVAADKQIKAAQARAAGAASAVNMGRGSMGAQAELDAANEAVRTLQSQSNVGLAAREKLRAAQDRVDAATKSVEQSRTDLLAARADIGIAQTLDPSDKAAAQVVEEARKLAEMESHGLGKNDAEWVRQKQRLWEARRASVEAAQAEAEDSYDVAAALELNDLGRAKIEHKKAVDHFASVKANNPKTSKEYKDALIGSVTTGQAVTQAAEAEAAAARQTRIARIAPGDAVGIAQARLDDARQAQRDARKFKTTSAQYQQATQQVIEAERAVTDSVLEVFRANANLGIALAEAAGRTVDAARLRYSEARKDAQRARRHSGGKRTAEVINAEAGEAQAGAAYRDAILQDKLGTIDFNQQMGYITANGAIAALQAILKATNLTRDQRRDLLLKIKGMKDDLRSQLTGSGFNIPDQIKLPTPYEVRRSLGIDKYVKHVQTTIGKAIGTASQLGAAASPASAAPTTATGSSNAVVAGLDSVRQAVLANGAQVVNDVSITNQVSTPAMVEAVAKRVVELITTSTAVGARANQATPKLVSY